MANPGVGNKFVSMNLNKSYGQPTHHNHSGSYGSNRTRPGVHGSSSGRGGMVVLSRPRSSQKTVPKLSVPPPLNLPSLRKEHERFDSLGSSGGHAGGGVAGSGSRPTSSSMGWTRPGAVALQEKEGHVDHGADRNDQGLQGLDGETKGGSMYTLPSARPGSTVPSSFASVEKKSVLRGEDFPSLQATLPSGHVQKQKDGQKYKSVDEPSNEHRDVSCPSSNVDMRPQLHVSHHSTSNGLNENVTVSHGGNSSRIIKLAQKQEDYFPVPLPLVRLNPRSDWADDERDTSHSLMDRGRDHGFSKSEAYWDRDFDMPRMSVPLQKPMRNFSERWGHRDNETGNVCSSEVSKVDPYTRDIRTSSREGREGNIWKNSSISKDGFGIQEVGTDINGFGPWPSSMSREISKENNKYSSFPFRENAHDDFRKREIGNRQRGAQPCHNSMGSYGGFGVDRNTRGRFIGEQYSRHSGDASWNSTVAKLPYSFNAKGLPVNDPILNLGRDKRPFSKSEKPYIEESFMKDFEANGYDGQDPFSAGLVGVAKKKKDALKQTDYHDPVRESFEAELERVQKMQEQERQRIIEEQERALEQARREEEERARSVREQEERQRRLEEEAREAAWRTEYERLETMRRAEEQRITREEEKQRILMEEERRKHAAKQKLLELEEKIAKRQAEVAKAGSSCSAGSDEKISVAVKEKEICRAADMGDWEDGERMVERITTASSDSSSFSRPSEMGSRPHFPRDNSSAFWEGGKSVYSWRKDVFENGNSSILHINDQDSGHHRSPRQDALGGRVFGGKEFYGGEGYTSSGTYKAGIAEPHADDYSHPKGKMWNLSGDGDHYSKNMGIDHAFHDNLAENFGDVGWGMGQSHGNPYSLYPERLYPNPEVDGPYSFGRSRYYTRQPRVLPPPIASMHKTAYRGEIEPSGTSPFLENERQYSHPSRSEPANSTIYANIHTENLRQLDMNDVQQGHTENVEQKVDSNARPRCDSQSSLSVSSPPNSPTHLSHDDLDESGESSMLLTEGCSKDVSQLTQEVEDVLPTNAVKEIMVSASSSISLGDDEEWTSERNERLQEQEEYDEDEDGFQEEDEVHEGDDENIDLTQEFDDMHLEDKGSPCMMDNLVLGFNEGVEVGMPNDDFEKVLKNEDGTFTMPQVSSSNLEERRSFDGISGDGQNSQPMGGSSRKFQETVKAVVDLVSQQSNSGQAIAASEILDKVDVSSSYGFASQHSVTSSVNQLPHSSSGQPVISAIGAVPNQAEVPLKLQFGLFSGPSLIPSPVPAIQIGSIHMPLHLHPYVGPLTHMHTSQPPLFQFGQLRYPSPVSQDVLPLVPQSMSFLQPNVPSSIAFNQNRGGNLNIQSDQESSWNLLKGDVMSLPVDNQTSNVSRHLEVCQEINSWPARENDDTSGKNQRHQPDVSCVGDKCSRSESGIHAENQGYLNSVVKNYAALSIGQKSESHPKSGNELSHPVMKEKELSGPNMSGTVSSSKGKRFVFMVKNSGSKSSYPASDFARAESGGYHRRPRHHVQKRTEFRVRYSADKRQPSSLASSEHKTMEEETNIVGRGVGVPSRNGPGKLNRSNMTSKQMEESVCLNSDPLSSREMDSASMAEKGAGEAAALTKRHYISPSGETNLKRNICSGEDVDAPLHSGIVRVFEQPGIEAPSDEDDFIEVRSKRQMLNDRREQREKEIKAKSRVSKATRKLPSSSKDNIATANAGKVPVSTGSETVNRIQPDYVATEGRRLINIESSNDFSTLVVSQPLAPIGTPAVKSENNSDIRSKSIRSVRICSIPGVSGALKSIGQGSMIDNNNNVLDSVPTSLGSWGNSQINQQVMTLTQNQLDEAMKSGQFDSQVNTRSISNSSMATSSILTKDKVLSSSSCPISFLLAGEKIQFGAVTSPTIIPPGSISASHGVGLLGPSRSDVQLPHYLSGPENDCDLLEKDERNSKSLVHLEDCEADAEAAASAVAAAAISSDESGGTGLGTCYVSISDTKSSGGADIDGITVGADDLQFSSQSRSEEPLSVSLPADLSVETPPISLWTPLPSPHNSSGQMLSPFPGGPPSHFPFYEMNPMLGGPVLAFGPHEESSSKSHQTSSQKSSTPASAPVGTWQQCHSGVDSFYGPPAAFTGPFISPPSGIPGVQGPPHMVVYNHFAPVGQFGQVGLSFMGTTYMPSGKQPDWKHTPSSAMGGCEGEMNNLNMVSTQRNPIQHMAPGSPLLPMASPLAMFDVFPFQSSADMTVQAHWPHLSSSHLSSVPMSLPLQQADVVLASKFGHGSIDQSLTANRFSNSQSSAAPGKSRNYPLVTDATITQLPDELGLVDPSSSSSIGVAVRSTTASMIVDSGKMDARQSGSSRSSNSNSKNQSSHPKNNVSIQNYNQSSGYNFQRTGGTSQKNSSGGEWVAHHRRTGSHGRNQVSGEKNYHSSKMKQIYVAKQTSTGTSTTS